MSNKAIAETILNQLGGIGRLSAMTGAKHFVAIENGVQFRIGRNAKKVNRVTVTLNAMDLYDTRYSSVRSLKETIRAESASVYNDMLRGDFERETGMYLTL
jgi:hypothetical protein